MAVMRRIWLLGIAAVVMHLTAFGSHAADIPPATIAVLDYQTVLRTCAACQQIRQKVESYREEFQNEIAGEETRLKRAEQALQQQRTILSPEAFEEKRRKFERDVIDTQRTAQDRIRQLERTFNVAQAQVQEAIIPIVQDMTRKMGFNVVVDKSQVLFARRQLDITEEVLKELDARLPRVEVPKPGK